MKTNEQLEVEILELRGEIEETNKKLNDVLAILSKPAVKEAIHAVTGGRKYTDEEIFNIRSQTSLSRASAITRLSVSTIQRACSRYQNKLAGLEDNNGDI